MSATVWRGPCPSSSTTPQRGPHDRPARFPAALPTEVRMRRIGLAVVLAVSLPLVPLAGEAQQAAKVWRIGWLGLTPPTSPPFQRISEAFLQGLRDHGFVEGQNIIIERRYSEGREDRHTAFVAEFVQMKVDLMVASARPQPMRPSKRPARSQSSCWALRAQSDRVWLSAWRDREAT